MMREAVIREWGHRGILQRRAADYAKDTANDRMDAKRGKQPMTEAEKDNLTTTLNIEFGNRKRRMIRSAEAENVRRKVSKPVDDPSRDKVIEAMENDTNPDGRPVLSFSTINQYLKRPLSANRQALIAEMQRIADERFGKISK
jgi:hypothetical protein